MNLFDLRRIFRSLSGRYDLVDDDTTGIVEFLINEACRNLDRLTEHQKTWGVHFVQAAIDDFKVSIPYARSIKEVWVGDGTNRWQLEKKPIQDIIYEYLSSAPTSGDSTYYSPAITRRIPEFVDISAFSAYMNFMDTSTDLDHNHNAIVFTPPTDIALLVEVRGFFYSAQLADDEDVNYWSVVHPMTLLKAALRELEVFNQNQGKVKLWDDALALEVLNINKDLTEEIISEVDQMEG